MLNDPFDLSDEMKDLSEIQKIAVVQWAMKHIVNHANEGGSYRYLIYDRLGFSPAAYAPLCDDGMTISNEFDFETKETAVNIVDAVINDKEGDEGNEVIKCDSCNMEYPVIFWGKVIGKRCASVVEEEHIIGCYGSYLIDTEQWAFTVDRPDWVKLGIICDPCVQKLMDNDEIKFETHMNGD
jgi:hypothetical protein|tara:strand:+ start:84 stop:629 length:546 start_codon:yes stop_codon:yes gene_type:complete